MTRIPRVKQRNNRNCDFRMRPRSTAAAVIAVLSWVLLLSCVTATSTADAHNVIVTAPAPPHDYQKGRRRLGGDKDATPAPSSAPSTSPTFVPSAAPTTKAPTMAPTAAPTGLPTVSPMPTSTPTAAPTMSPSSAPTGTPTTSPTFGPYPGSVGDLVLKLSVVDTTSKMTASNSNKTTANDILSGRAPALTTAVLQSLLTMLCREMNVRVVSSGDDMAANYCDTHNNRRETRHLQAFAEDSIVVSTARLDVMDNRANNNLTWTEWTVNYPVLQIGDIYLQTALQNNPNLTLDELVLEGLVIFQSVARLALSAEISDGTLHSDWPEPQKSSLTGREVETYSGLPEETEDDDEQDGYWDTLKPAPMHGLRIAGICLFCASIFFWVSILQLAKRKRQEREWDKEFKERGRGGLVTEEGLDFMLEQGRRESIKQNLVDGDELEQNLNGHFEMTATSQPQQQQETSQQPTAATTTTPPASQLLADDSPAQQQLDSILNLGIAGAGEGGSDDGEDTNSALFS